MMQLGESKMNVKEMIEYIQYLETYTEQIQQDQAQFFKQHIDLLKMTVGKLNETLSLFAYAAVYNEGELRFPKSYFELHKDMNYGIEFDQNSDENFVVIRLTKQDSVEEEEDGTDESIRNDGEGTESD